MRIDTKIRQKARVEVAIDIIKDISEKEAVPEAFKDKLNAMSYEDLGALVMHIVKTRSVDEILN
ncbi:hypothetical protein [Paenibacillus sp. Soil522]|uniref:hypothetical protein n=1 Tax=Paenibacillus sp. Soil522 TaxID=1736388 RepID=UPI0006F765E9|nr:hypothetical protein [Paenibacillus sp. Soil522]KRE41812.1 hypothetical protein ASG81_16210 [Paenibacillus sp. Soil522]